MLEGATATPSKSGRTGVDTVEPRLTSEVLPSEVPCCSKGSCDVPFNNFFLAFDLISIVLSPIFPTGTIF